MSEAEEDVSRFTVDGVVAEMVIEVEDNDNPKVRVEDLTNSPEKDFTNDDCVQEVENEDELSEDINSEEQEDEENSFEALEDEEEDIIITEDENLSIKDDENLNVKDDENLNVKDDENMSIEEDSLSPIEEKNSNQTLNKKRKRDLSASNTENMSKVNDGPRYSGRKRLANKRYISEDMITPKYKSSKNKSESQSKDTPTGVKRRKLVTDSKEEKQEMKTIANDKYPKRASRNIKEPGKASVNEEVKKAKNEESAIKIKKEIDDNKFESGNSLKGPNIEIEVSKSKQSVLRKLPFRKNRDAPDVPDIKPKVFWWNGVGEGVGAKLGDIEGMKERIKGAKSVRALYRVLFFQWPTNGQDLITQILDFNGFPFDKSSYEFTKRQSLMKIMLDVTISNLCEILGLKKGDKQTMINNILEFLLRPYMKVDPTLDPSLQPVVVLERIDLDDYLDQISEDSQVKKGISRVSLKKTRKMTVEESLHLDVPARTTRNSASRRKSVEISIVKKSEKPKYSKPGRPRLKPAEPLVSKTISKGKTTPVAKDTKVKTTPVTKDIKAKTTPVTKDIKAKTTPVTKDIKAKTSPMPKTSLVAAKDTKTKTALVKDATASPKEKKKAEERLESPSKSVDEDVNSSKKFKKMMSVKLSSSKKIMDKKSLDSSPKQKFIGDKTKEKDIDNDIEEMDIDNAFDADDFEMDDVEEPKSPERKSVTKQTDKKTLEKGSKKVSIVSTVNLSDSSETESAEETKLVTSARKSRPPMKRKGKPLGHFPKISACIQKANFSALQRLHILLFGASDKADNLKANILAFGGFPFLEGSDEWKQKHFLLSLLAQNNLREYLNLLCIQYADDDQPTMINKLMKFLAAPTDGTTENKVPIIETEVVSSQLTNKAPAPVPSKGKVEAKKKVKKKDEPKKPGPKHRKVLMSEEEARRLEASFAREQRAIAREAKAPPPIKPQSQAQIPVAPRPNPLVQQRQQINNTIAIKRPVADPRQLNALLQTVYKRRALKAAGAVVSTPNKGEKTKLGDIENIKFLIVTGSINDLEILHHLIFMSEVAKSKLRKNILDFDGFGFNEDSERYKERMDFLNSLGYDVSKRLSFLLGLCSLQTEIPQQDLNELLMYFLMSPCRTKQVVPITEMPSVAPGENFIMVKSTYDAQSPTRSNTSSPRFQISRTSANENMLTSTPLPQLGHQKARKSFHSSSSASVSISPSVSPVKGHVLLPRTHSVAGAALVKQALGNKAPITLLNSVPAVPSYSLAKMPTNMTVLNAPNSVSLLDAGKSSNINQLVKLPVNPGTKVQVVNQPAKIAILDAATKIPATSISTVAGQILQNPVIIPQISQKTGQNVMQAPVLPGSKIMMKTSTTPGSVSQPQEFLVQQQTPDGQQKTFKLIRLPASHPLASVVGKPPAQQTLVSPQVQQQLILANSPTPGLVLMKNSSGLPTTVQNVQSSIQKNIPIAVKTNTAISSPQSNINKKGSGDFILPDEGQSADETSANSTKNSEDDIVNSSQENPPTDEELFSSIQELILSSNFEDITLRNVIERVSAQFPLHNLQPRHSYMKECVKKIIIGT